MHAIDHVVTGLLKIKHSHGKKISSSRLNGGLKHTAADQSVPAPLPGESILAVNSDAHPSVAPRCVKQLELWPLPVDNTLTG